MTKAEINVQDTYLLRCLKSAADVRIELTTGAGLEGALRRFDRFAVVIEVGGEEVLVYKHAIASVRQQLGD